MKNLRLFLSFVLVAIFAMTSNAQKPASGIYKIKNASTGKYITIQGRYYAKPDASVGDDITVGVGITNYTYEGTTATADGSYRLYSLGGEYNGTQIEIFEYLDKAVRLAKEIGSQKISQVINTYIEQQVKNRGGSNWDSMTDEEKEQAIADAMGSEFWGGKTYSDIVTMLDGLAREVIDAYKVDYGYISVIPSGNGTQLKVSIPTIPVSVDKVCQAFTGKDAWTWACGKIVETLEARGSDTTLQALVRNNLSKVSPGKTYYLTADTDDSFGYTESSSDAASYWTMELQTESKDNLVSGMYLIQNKGTEKFVEVTEKYYAKPDVDGIDPEAISFDDIAKLGINLEIGRVDRSDANLYQITDMSSNGASIAAYTAKTISLAKTTVLNTMDSKQSTMESIIRKINDMLGSDVTYAEARQDVSDFVDTYAEAYGNLKLEATGENEAKLYVQIPTIPDFLQFFYQWYKKDTSANLMDWLKAQVKNYLENSGTDATLKALVLNNIDNVQEGAKYYLTADADDTFGYYDANTGSGSNDTWKLVVPAVKQYVRIMNSSDDSYVNITGKTEISTISGDDRLQAPGTVILIEGPINALTSLRSQGVDAVSYVDALNSKIASTGLKFSVGITPAEEIDGVQTYFATTTIPTANPTVWASIKETLSNITLPETFAFFESVKTVMASANPGETIYMNGGAEATKDIDAATRWIIKPITAEGDETFYAEDTYVKFEDNYYLTRCFDFNVELDASIKAFGGTVDLDNHEFVLSPITGIIKAGTPFIVQTTDGKAVMTPTLEEASAVSTGLQTTETFFKEDVDSSKKYYTLSSVNGKGGFYLYNGSKLLGNRAFIAMDKEAASAAGSKGWTIILEESSEATGISEVDAENTKADVVYDLQGRRVNNPVKGIYIVNGKKVIK